jgi:hypothetical protein
MLCKGTIKKMRAWNAGDAGCEIYFNISLNTCYRQRSIVRLHSLVDAIGSGRSTSYGEEERLGGSKILKNAWIRLLLAWSGLGVQVTAKRAPFKKAF